MQNEHSILRVPVNLTMTDGRNLIGDFILSLGGELERTLNSDAKYIHFDETDGQRRFIAKSAILDAFEVKKERRPT